MADVLGWTETRIATEVASTRAELAEVHGVKLGASSDAAGCLANA
jgi:glycerol-3-phosphate dehydrogenase